MREKCWDRMSFLRNRARQDSADSFSGRTVCSPLACRLVGYCVCFLEGDVLRVKAEWHNRRTGSVLQFSPVILWSHCRDTRVCKTVFWKDGFDTVNLWKCGEYRMQPVTQHGIFQSSSRLSAGGRSAFVFPFSLTSGHPHQEWAKLFDNKCSFCLCKLTSQTGWMLT